MVASKTWSSHPGTCDVTLCRRDELKGLAMGGYQGLPRALNATLCIGSMGDGGGGACTGEEVA